MQTHARMQARHRKFQNCFCCQTYASCCRRLRLTQLLQSVSENSSMHKGTMMSMTKCSAIAARDSGISSGSQCIWLGKSWWQEREGLVVRHPQSGSREQWGLVPSLLPPFDAVQNLAYRRCHPQWGWVFPLGLTQSRKASQTCPVAGLLDSRSCQVDDINHCSLEAVYWIDGVSPQGGQEHGGWQLRMTEWIDLEEKR